jgi:hypothetical protein
VNSTSGGGSITLYSDKVYTVNVGGRGALVIAEQEFRDLLSSGLALFEIRTSAKEAPTPTSCALTD